MSNLFKISTLFNITHLFYSSAFPDTPDLAPPGIKLWSDDKPLFESRMNSLGFEVSDTQPDTPALGSCGIEAMLGNKIKIYHQHLSLNLSF